MIIGGTMEKQNIIDFNLSSMSMEYKREFFYKLDLALKQIHMSGGFVSNFNPDSIYIDINTRTPSFEAVYPFQTTYSDSEDVKKANLLWLADLAFCSYLPDYNLNSGLLNPEVVSLRFEDFKEYFPEDDVDYYRQIFTMNYSDRTLTPSYYSDYIKKQLNDGSKSQSNGMHYVKSTPAGKAMSTRDSEAAYINYVFMTCVVLSFTILIVFVLMNMMNIFS